MVATGACSAADLSERALHVGDGVGRRSVVGDAAAGEEEELVKEGEDVGARLVDRQHQDHPVGAGHGLEAARERERGGGVEAGRRLVEEEQRRPSHELCADGGALPLPAADAALLLAADGGVRAVLQAELLQGRLHPPVALLVAERLRQPQPGGKLDRLAYRQRGEEEVVLEDEAAPAEEGLGRRGAAERHLPRLQFGALGSAAREEREQRRLARAARAHQCDHLGGRNAAAHVVEYDLALPRVGRTSARAAAPVSPVRLRHAHAQPEAAPRQRLLAEVDGDALGHVSSKQAERRVGYGGAGRAA